MEIEIVLLVLVVILSMYRYIKLQNSKVQQTINYVCSYNTRQTYNYNDNNLEIMNLGKGVGIDHCNKR